MNIELKDISTIVAALITSGAFYTGLKFFIRRREDSGAIVVKTAEGVVVMQSGIIKDLRDEIKNLRKENDDLRLRVRALEQKLDIQSDRQIESERHIADLENPK